MPVLLSLLASLLWGTADFLGGTASRRLPTASVVGVSQLVALLGLVPVALRTGALDEPRAYVLPGILAGVVGPLALAACKQLIARVPEMARADAFAWTGPMSTALFASAEGQEGITAFREKRDASWVPRA